MKLTLNAPLRDLDGKPIGDQTLARSLAVDIANSAEAPAIKYLDWALALQREGVIEIDAADFESLKSYVEVRSRLTVLVKGQILKALLEGKNGESK